MIDKVMMIKAAEPKENIPTIAETEDAMHKLFTALTKNQIKWNDFKDVGIDEWYHDYYYAENMLYLIHDRITDSIEFYRAGSPKEAYEIWEEAHKFFYSEEDCITDEEVL